MKVSKNLPVPDLDQENQEKFEIFLKKTCPELFYIFLALQQTEIEPRIVIEFIYQLRNVIDDGWGKVWIDVLDKKPTFIQAKRIVKLDLGEK